MPPYQAQQLPLSSDLLFQSPGSREQLIKQVGQASRALARYDGLLQALPNPGLMLSPLTNQEAVLSSKIEGTQATIEEVFEFEAGGEQDESTRQDIQEIQNYRTALTLGAEYVEDRKNGGAISLWLVKALHEKLMTSVRGQDKTPGQFRKDQNWIGAPGSGIEQASFVPPSPLALNEHMQNWADYLSSDRDEPLIQAAIMHAQFELLHPFNDGNGRMGRLIIPLFLYGKEVIGSPSFYLSEYLEKNRDRYYAHLAAISAKQDWANWLAFFLTAIAEQAQTNTARLQQIIALHDWSKGEVQRITRSQHSAAIVDALFTSPVFRAADLADKAGMERPSIYPIIRKLEQNALIEVVEPGKGRRSGLYLFAELLNTVEGRKVV